MTADPDSYAAFKKQVLDAAAPLDRETAALIAALLPIGQGPVEEFERGSEAA